MTVRRWLMKAVFAVGAIFLPIDAEGLSLVEPVPFVYSSHGGVFLVRVEPGAENGGGKQATAQVFKFNEKTKSFETGTTFPLENRILPGSVLVAEDGSRFVGVNDWSDFEYANPVVIVYNEKGRVLKKYWIEDFLSKEEAARVRKKSGGVPERWAEAVVLPGSSMEIRVIRELNLSESKRENFVIDLKNLKIRNWDPLREGGVRGEK